MKHPRDRDEAPGIREIPSQALPPFITEHVVESCAVHSRSKGWLPAVRIEIHTADGNGLVGTVTVDDAIAFVDIILDACERAEQDYTAAVMNGLKK